MPTKNELLAVYRATSYRVFLPGGIADLRIDTAHPGLAAWLAAEHSDRWAILTAFNPGSGPLAAAENAERQARLECRLLEAGYEPFAGENLADDGAWPVEDACFVAGIDAARAVELAAAFGQKAIVCGAADGIPRLLWVEPGE